MHVDNLFVTVACMYVLLSVISYLYVAITELDPIPSHDDDFVSSES